MAASILTAEELLHDEIALCYADPLRFVKLAYPWGEPGPLEKYKGPDSWQTEFLIEVGEEVRKRKFDGFTPVMPIKTSTASGHGIGKSVLVAFLVNWLMSTRRDAKGTVTANTFQQLKTKTWATIQTWTKRSITKHWFEVTDLSLYRIGYKESWFCTPQSCDEKNSEAFAGQHNATSTSFYIFDEASAVPNPTWDVAEGGLTDGEPMIFAFGNPTRSQGKFFEVTFGRDRHRWRTRSIDSRDCQFSNKELIKEWIEDKGEDSDFVRVRVKGIPPNASDAQFIDNARVSAAQKRDFVVLADEPLVAGVDMAWGGSDDNVVRFRRGRDARSIKPIRIPGEKTRTPDVMVVKLAEVLNADYNGRKVHTMFVDSAGIAGPVVQRLRELGHKNVHEINFGADSPDIGNKYRYYRDFMWASMKDWLVSGAIDADPQLEADLVGPGYFLDKATRLQLESKKDMKKRGVDSPDDADALALTFARQIAIASPPKVTRPFTPYSGGPVSQWG